MSGFKIYVGLENQAIDRDVIDRMERIIEAIILKFNSDEVEFNLDILEGKVFDDCVDSGIGIDLETVHNVCVDYFEKKAKSHKRDDHAPLIIFQNSSKRREP